MVLTDERIEIEKARAYGAALGITAQGKIDLDADRLDIEGTIVPAYVVSQIIGGIPLIGRILTGGEGEGLFAATYRAEGLLGRSAGLGQSAGGAGAGVPARPVQHLRRRRPRQWGPGLHSAAAA